MKRKPSPQLSSSSSSEEDEDATSEEEAQSKEDVKEQQPKQVQEDEESEEEEESSDDEEKGEEDEEEEEEEEGQDDNEKVIDLSSPRSSQFKIAVRETAAEKPKSPPPPAKQKHGAVKPPAKPVESKPPVTDTKKAKPAVSSPLRIPPSSPPQKRAADVKEANGSKKRKVGDAKPDQNSPAVVAASSADNDQKRRRVWDDETGVRLLRTYLEHLRKGVNDVEIYDEVLKVLGGSFNKRQLREKMRNLKIKYEAMKEKGKGKPVFKTAHEEELYEFGKKIWGDREDNEQKDLQEHTRNEKSNANSIGRGNTNEKPNAKISDVERSSSKSKVENGEPDSKLKKSSVAYMEIDVHPDGDNHVVEGKKDDNGNQNIDNQAGVKVSAQILENGDSQGDLCEYEMIGSGELYMKTDDLVKEGLSIAVKSGNLGFQQELRELGRIKKELKVLQLEIILRQVKLAQAAIGAQK